MQRFWFIGLTFLCLSAKAQYNNIYVQSAWAERDKWQHPGWIIDATGIKEGSVVADIGSHEGYMTVKFARVVGATGEVYAVDVNAARLQQLQEILKDQSIHNVKTVQGEFNNPMLPRDKMDAVLILDTYHEIDDYMEVLGHVKASLKADGRLVIIEPIADERKHWSREKQTGRHEIAIRYVLDEVKEAGFRVVKKEDMFLDRTEEKGDKLWMLVLKKD